MSPEPQDTATGPLSIPTATPSLPTTSVVTAILLPWWRESAFRAWIKKTGAAFSGAFLAIATRSLPKDVEWWWALVVALLYSASDLALSAADIWFSGPDVYQPPPPPKPPTPEDEIKALQARVIALEKEKASAAPPALPPTP